MGHNRVTIFSNGIADFVRRLQVRREQPLPLSIPVRKDHVADVLGSLGVYGDVRLASPPSFRPENEWGGSLELDSARAIEGLLERLAGATVRLQRGDKTIEGRLLGLHKQAEGTAGEPITVVSAAVLTPTGVARVPLREVAELSFLDEAVQTELDKTLKRRYQQIKPQGTFVELTLTTDAEQAEADVQYVIPAAAWKISYRLILRDDLRRLQGFAVVDNNTEEDWNDVIIAVVTGEPITFSTDLAESKTPRRRHVNVVRDEALGAVEVEEGVAMAAMEDRDALAAAPASAASFALLEEQSGRQLRRKDNAKARHFSAAPAQLEQAEARDVGDFNVFESSTPVSIAAGRSAVVPIFQLDLEDVQPVLHYNNANHPERPFRSIRLTNNADYGWARGVCTVYEDGAYGGSCIVPATKPTESRLLPHALDTSVRVVREQKRLQRTLVGLRLSEGVCYTRLHERRQTVYEANNVKDDAPLLLVDHAFNLREPQVKCSVKDAAGKQSPLEVKEKLQQGVRLEFSLPPRESVAVTVVESATQTSSVQLIEQRGGEDRVQLPWLMGELRKIGGELIDDPSIAACLELQRQLDGKQAEVEQAKAEVTRLAGRQERLRKNIEAVGRGEESARPRADLLASEDRLTELEEKTIPALEDERRAILERLKEAIRALATEWESS